MYTICLHPRYSYDNLSEMTDIVPVIFWERNLVVFSHRFAILQVWWPPLPLKTLDVLCFHLKESINKTDCFLL